jgi:wyosine [tRNA(Phe)-imidazoG37] synthetase (radical SAM superfamily)
LLADFFIDKNYYFCTFKTRELNMLFTDIVFGPIQSRRLGISLGINVLPSEYKVCNFDCCYCECGFNEHEFSEKHNLPSMAQVVTALEEFVEKTSNVDMNKITSITFSGNGEPTLNPEFAYIASVVSRFRREFIPKAKISLLTNGTRIGRPEVQNAVKYLDNLIIKLDSGTAEQYMAINRPAIVNFDKMIENLVRFGSHSIIQTLLLKSTNPEENIDNTTDEQFASYMRIIKMVKPKRIMLYGIDRQTPNTNLVKLSTDQLEEYANRLRFIGVPTDVY